VVAKRASPSGSLMTQPKKFAEQQLNWPNW
jgi:hypothetical protein